MLFLLSEPEEPLGFAARPRSVNGTSLQLRMHLCRKFARLWKGATLMVRSQRIRDDSGPTILAHSHNGPDGRRRVGWAA